MYHKRDRLFSSSISITVVQEQVCRFFIQNKCLKGDLCQYSHDLTPSELTNSEHNTCSGSPQDSICETPCSICLQPVISEGKRFGLLPRCNHVFCLDCILSWRAKSASDPINRQCAKLCPVCRIPSYFVIPSPKHFRGNLKLKRAIEYLTFLAQKPCRYFSESANIEICPYGPLCFFHHHYSYTLPVGDEKISLVFTDGRQDLGINN